MTTKIFAHRGANLTYPENSLDAFAEAMRLGADGIELDVQRSADGMAVVIHDEELTRLTGQPGYVHELTYADLQRRRIKGPNGTSAAIPTLNDALALFARSGLEINLELKNNLFPAPGLEDAVIRLVRQHGLAEQVIYSSFNHVSMKRLAEHGFGSQTALLFSEWLYRPWDYAATVGAAGLHPSYNVLQYPNLVNMCQANGIAVRTWTVDHPDHIRLVLALAPDAIITNDLVTAMTLRDAQEAAQLQGDDV